jgi:hypothetical protein
MMLRVLIHTILLWGVTYVGLLLARETNAPGILLVAQVLSEQGGLTFAAAAAVGANNATKAAIPLTLLVLLATLPFNGMPGLARTVAPLGIGLAAGFSARGLLTEPKVPE